MIAEPAVKLRPELKIIFISGYPAEITESGSAIAFKAPILAKPFTMDTLHNQIKLLLC
jgi:two-component SAPR family response regulator